MIKKHMYMTCMQIEEKSANAIIYLGRFNNKIAQDATINNIMCEKK